MVRTVYLMFCDQCGCPKEISKHIMHEYIKSYVVNRIYCSNCHFGNSIPHFLRKLSDELFKEGV